jgi:DNA-binding protein HU-beta
MPTPKLTNEIIVAAILGFEQQKRQIDTKIGELRAMLPGGPAQTAATPEAPIRKRKKFSAGARKRMKEAQQRRWAKIRGEFPPPAPATPKPERAKRQLSKAGRANIVAATKKRWAAKKAEAVKAAPAVAKKSTVKRSAAKQSPVKKTQKKAAAKKAANAPAQTTPAAQ